MSVRPLAEAATGQAWMQVSQVAEGQQAAAAGVELGMYMLKVQGYLVVGLSHAEVVELVTSIRPLQVRLACRHDTMLRLPANGVATGCLRPPRPHELLRGGGGGERRR